jgi:hypothetical protein
MTVKRTRKPAGLGPDGAQLWAEVVAEMASDGIVPTSRDRRWLADACATADRVADLEAALAGQPRVVLGSQKQLVAHPLIAEIRMHRTTLATLLARVEMTAQDAVAAPGVQGRFTSATARSAALARHGSL